MFFPHSPSDLSNYIYNGDGVRVAQIENGLRTDYVQDVAAALPQVLLAQQGGTVSKYLRGLGLIGEQTGGTGPNAAPATWQYHLPDALGSVRQIADPTGQLLLTQRFDPFGGLLQRSSAGGPRSAYGFAGEEQDSTSGQLFLRARTYNPATGRFLQSDPVLGTPNDPRTLHHYAYAFNNPVNYSDPSGLWVGTREQPRGQAQPQNSKLQALINSYTAPLQTQLAYAGNLGKNGFNRSHLGAAGNLGSQGAQRSSIGQEGQFWQNQSDPEPRDQSQGHRQGPCGIGSLLVGIRDAGRAVMDTTKKIGSELEQDWTNHWNNCHGFDCGPYLPNSPTLNKVGREVKNFVLENPDVVIGMIPVIGDLYDAMSGLAGVDLLTGRTLSKAEWGLALGAGLLGLFTGADELVDGLALLGRAANKLSPAKLVGKGLDIVDKGFGALKTGAKALREIGQAGLSQVDELAQTVSRFGRNAGQVADEVAAAAVDAGRLADNADEAALSLSRMDELMGERRVFSQAETRAAFSGGADGPLSNRLNPGCPGNSFTAGTPVETEEGQKPIEEIKVGDKVLAEDPETGEQGYFEVVALTNHPTDEVLRVTIEAEATLKGAGAQAEAEKETSTLDTNTESGDNDQAQLNSGADDEDRPTFQPSNLPTLQLTPDHPVYVEGKGWLWAENLAIGDRLRRADGGFAKVLAVERVKLAEPEVVYNFTVKGPHTYFVLEVGVLVHNAGGSCLDYGSLSDEELVARIQNEKDAEAVFEAVFNRGFYVNDKRFGLKPHEIEQIVVPTHMQLPTGEPIPLSGPEFLEYVSKNQDQLVYNEALQAFVEPISGVPVGFRNANGEFEFLPTHILKSEGRWTQGSVGSDVYSKFADGGKGGRVSLEEAAKNLRDFVDQAGEIPREQLELLVFRKTPAMDEWGETTRFATKNPEPYSGLWPNLGEAATGSINNRTFTVATMADLGNTKLPVRWATEKQIRFFSYQYDAREFGTEILLRDRDEILTLDGRIIKVQ